MLILLFGCAVPAWPNEMSGDMLLFPDVTVVRRTFGDEIQKKEVYAPALDFFYSQEQRRILVLAEFYLADGEHDMERLQVGIAPAPSYKIWLGRFHTPLSYWDNTYHHGAYMQPSITRPGIARFEDEQGVLPVHTTGFLLDGSEPLTTALLHYELALGVGPVLKDALYPVDILAPTQEHGGRSISAKLGLRQPDNEMDEAGIVAGYTEIPITGQLYTYTKQTVAGAYVGREWQQWRFIGELLSMQNRLESPQADFTGDFTSSYVHGEYKVSREWTGYSRLEWSTNAQNPYLDMFPGFIRGRAIMGGRWEPLRNQAIKFELWRSERQDGRRFNGLGMQWSMVYP